MSVRVLLAMIVVVSICGSHVYLHAAREDADMLHTDGPRDFVFNAKELGFDHHLLGLEEQDAEYLMLNVNLLLKDDVVLQGEINKLIKMPFYSLLCAMSKYDACIECIGKAKFRKKLAAAQQHSSTFALLLANMPHGEDDEKERDERLAQVRAAALGTHEDAYKQLSMYVAQDNVDKVSQLIKDGAPVNYTGDYSIDIQPLLIVAAKHNAFNVASVLIAAGADISVMRAREALSWAAVEGNVEMVKLLLAAGAGMGAEVRCTLRWIILGMWDTPDYFRYNNKNIDEHILNRIIHLLVMSDVEYVGIDMSKLSPRFQKMLSDAIAFRSALQQEVDAQDWETLNIQEQASPDSMIRQDLVDVATRRRVWADQGVKVNMQWVGKTKGLISNEEKKAGKAALKAALLSKDIAAIKQATLDADGVDVLNGLDINANIIEDTGETALMFAVRENLDEVAAFLIEHNACVDTEDKKA